MNKVMINRLFVDYIDKPKTGRTCKVHYWRIIRAILYKLRTGVQWHLLPIKQLFGKHSYTWQSVYYHFNKWSQMGQFKVLLMKVIKANKHRLDTSIVSLDGTHTICKKGGEQVGYQGRKKSKTTNRLILTDKNGVIIACSDAISGEHNDLYEIEKTVTKMLDDICKSGLNPDGMFLLADSGFDSQKLRYKMESFGVIPQIDRNKRRGGNTELSSYVIDKECYKNRFVVEQNNAWLDANRSLLVRFETSAHCANALYQLGAVTDLYRKFNLLTFSF